MDEWIALNRTNWDERAAPHAASPDYAVERFVADPAFLSDVVRFDLPRLPDVRGKRGVHLQCHIGTDTLSLARLGAEMTGLDFSAPALAEATALAARAGASIRFVESTVDGALDVLEPGSFDFVYTGIGAICWLPDIAAWARTVAGLLRPGGELFIRDGHPMLWAIDEARMDALTVRYPYFETAEPQVFDEPGTYVASEHEFVHTRTASWSHGIGETITALFAAGLRLTLLEEHRSVPWEALPGRMVRTEFDEWRLAEGEDLLPLTFTIRAVKER
ncbi:class I SAM-dependent methyltransferase [Amnibacterium kyonggiense]|uniref:Methyltransferase family protein n=1 Tax=Amnibacterium kyonggiense TaxID=595671 RepID=A0A4R7FPK4_9MICO|nr:class I SAM-dependent methyltransferase [Amnibacterium kyonggiense]TDS79633.1 methyltransferase family protein [Amnibacterium kyonggiense]